MELIRQTDHDATVTIDQEADGYRFRAYAHNGEEIINELHYSLSSAVRRVTIFWIDEFDYEGTPIAKRVIEEVVTDIKFG